MTLVIALAIVMVAGTAVVSFVMRGERTWLDEPAPRPEPPPVPERGSEPAVQQGEPVLALAPFELTTPGGGNGHNGHNGHSGGGRGPAPDADGYGAPVRREAVAAPRSHRLERASVAVLRRRRVRFEEVATLTVPDAFVAEPGARTVSVPAVALPEKVRVRIPFTTRLFGAVRLVLLVAVSAAAVTLAVVGAGYLVIDRVLGGL